MPIYRNVVVDIPPGGYIEKSDQSVFVKDKNEYDPVLKLSQFYELYFRARKCQ